jgi:uncharacterized repeat protein (TIGR02543 family)
VATPDITLLAPATRADYTFGGWYGNARFTGDAVTEIPTGSTGNKTFYAKWTVNSYNQPITLTINDFTDPAADAFTETTFTMAKSGESKTKTINISGLDSNGATAVWHIGLAQIGTGRSVTLSAANLSLGKHTLRVTALYGGVKYSKELAFTVME